MDEKLKKAFYEQKYHAENIRNIKFLLTFAQWLDIWEKSGHLEERGRRSGQYCMSRYGDIGDYAIGNVFIQLHSSNVSDAMKGKPLSEETKAKMKGIPKSEETKAKMSTAKKGKPSPHKGKKRGPYKKKISDDKKGIQ